MTDDARTRRLLVVTAIATSITAIASVVGLAAAWRVLRPADWVDIGAIGHACQADRNVAECTVTNIRTSPAKTCFHVTLTNRAHSEDAVTSVNMCTGSLAPHDSKTIRGVWGTSITKACYSPSTSKAGRPELDFDACEMRIVAGGY